VLFSPNDLNASDGFASRSLLYGIETHLPQSGVAQSRRDWFRHTAICLSVILFLLRLSKMLYHENPHEARA
jgi:hypothetical protein